MKIRQSSILETVRRVGDFIDRNANVLGTINQSGTRATLARLDGELDVHAADQAAGALNSRRGTAAQRALRLSLRLTYMRPIANIAHARLASVPDYVRLRMPDVRANTARLVAAAKAMSEAAKAHEAIFVEAGMPADFVAKFNAASDELNASIDARATQRQRGVRATTGLKSAAKEARDEIKVIDSMVSAELRDDAPLLGEWKNAKRITRTATRAAAAPPVIAPPVTPPPVTPPAQA
jgi:hypothetical protein